MIDRYSNPKLNDIFDPTRRLQVFDRVELAGIQAKEKLSIPGTWIGLGERMRIWIDENPPDEKRRKEIEDLNDHDFQAYVSMRLEKMPGELAKWFHSGFTTFDTQDPSDQLIMLGALKFVKEKFMAFKALVRERAIKDADLLMMLRTHG